MKLGLSRQRQQMAASQIVILMRRLGRRSLMQTTNRLLGLSIVICTTVAAALGFFASSVQTALDNDIASYLGAPLVVRSDQPLPKEILADVVLTGSVNTVSFTTGAISQAGYQSVSLKGVSESYPLQGELLIQNTGQETSATAHQLGIGQAWLDQRVLDELSLQLGDRFQIGRAHLTVSAVLVHEPDRLTQLQHALPRVMVSMETLEQTGVSVGNDRGEYRFLVAGSDADLNKVETQLATTWSQSYEILRPGEGRHPFSRISQRAERLLNLILILLLLLCGSAAATLTDHAFKHYASAATVLRCLGVNRRSITWAFCLQQILLAFVMSVIGCALGWLVQPILIAVMEPHMTLTITPISLNHLVGPIAIGLVTVSVFVLPKLNALSVMSVSGALRGQNTLPKSPYLTALLASVTVVAVLWLSSDNLELTLMLVTSVILVVMLSLGFGWTMSKLSGLAHHIFRGPIKVSVRAIGRSSARHLTPMTSTALVMLAILMTVTLRGSFIDALQLQTLEADGNYLISGLPAQRVAEFESAMQSLNVPIKGLYPTVSARLVTVNGVELDQALAKESDTREETRSKVRLSWAERLPENNTLRSGAWPSAGTNEVSVEYEVMSDLGLSIGDELGFQVGDQLLRSTITSQREYRGGGSRMMFWFMFAPDTLTKFEQRYMGGLLINPNDSAVLAQITSTFPEVRVTDLERQISGIRDIMIVLTRLMNTVLTLLLMGALMVITATSYVNASNKRRHAVLLRALGLRRRQIVLMNITEHLVIAVIACLVGVIGVQIVAGLMFQNLFALPYALEWETATKVTAVICSVFAALGVAFTGRQWRQPVLPSLE